MCRGALISEMGQIVYVADSGVSDKSLHVYIVQKKVIQRDKVGHR